MKPAPFQIFIYPPNDPNAYWPYWMKADSEPGEQERRALIMRHAAELLHELKAALEILAQVLDHQRDGKPLPLQTAVRHVAMDVWNVIDLAEGRKTEGTRFYPPPEES